MNRVVFFLIVWAAGPWMTWTVQCAPQLDLGRVTETEFHLFLRAVAGQEFLLQRSQDLAHWQDWTLVMAHGFPTEVVDNIPSERSGRGFYRAADAWSARSPVAPKVVWTFPSPGAASVNPDTELRIRFDRAMGPKSYTLYWDRGGAVRCGAVTYDAQKFEFVMPVQLSFGMNNVQISKDYQLLRDGFVSSFQIRAPQYDLSFRTKGSPTAVAPKPQLTSVSPALLSSVPILAFVELTFDQPMLPPEEAFPYLSPSDPWGPKIVSKISYDASTHRFTVPVVSPPETNWSIIICGFRNVSGVAADPIDLTYHVVDQLYSDDFLQKSQQWPEDPILTNVVMQMKRTRVGIQALDEVVQALAFSRSSNLITRATSQSARFKWQAGGQFLADVSQAMLSVNLFVVGSDGQQCWWRSNWSSSNTLQVAASPEIQQKNLAFCDPFNFLNNAEGETLRALHARYVGTNQLNGSLCHVIESWSAEKIDRYVSASSTEWWIDARTYLPIEVRSFYGGGFEGIYAFGYQSLNQPISELEFAVPNAPGVTRVPLDSLDSNYNIHFLNAEDGSNGIMSVRWGKKGPIGRYSDGLN